MANLLTIRTKDESTQGDVVDGPVIQVPDGEEIRVSELISMRVRAEVAKYNSERPSVFTGLIQPTDTESFLNGPVKRQFKPIDADIQVKVALEAFDRQRFLVLLPQGQANTLDQAVRLHEGDEVSFMRLVPLVGG